MKNIIDDISFIILRILSILSLSIGIIINDVWVVFLGLLLLVLSNNQMINELQTEVKIKCS